MSPNHTSHLILKLKTEVLCKFSKVKNKILIQNSELSFDSKLAEVTLKKS